MARWAPPELVAAALTGGESAIERLITAVWPSCFRFAVQVIGDRDLGEDAAQEACAILYRKIRSVRSADAFEAWMYRIIMHEAARVRGRRIEYPSQAEHSATHDGTTSLDVRQALALLSPPLRDVTILFYFDDLKTEEIAGVLRIPHATVRTRLARARERLSGLLGDYADASSSVGSEVNQHAL